MVDCFPYQTLATQIKRLFTKHKIEKNGETSTIPVQSL